MAIRVACGNCGTNIRADQKVLGKRVKCPKCGAAVIVSGSPEEKTFKAGDVDDGATRPAQTTPSEPSSRRCPSCGADLAEKAILCVQCGLNLTTGQRMETVVSTSSAPDVSRSRCYLRGGFLSWKLSVRDGKGAVIARVRRHWKRLDFEKEIKGRLQPWLVVKHSAAGGLDLYDHAGKKVGSIEQGEVSTLAHDVLAKYAYMRRAKPSGILEAFGVVLLGLGLLTGLTASLVWIVKMVQQHGVVWLLGAVVGFCLSLLAPVLSLILLALLVSLLGSLARSLGWKGLPYRPQHRPQLVVSSPFGADVELTEALVGYGLERRMHCDIGRRDFDLCLLLCVLHAYGLPHDRLAKREDELERPVYTYRIVDFNPRVW